MSSQRVCDCNAVDGNGNVIPHPVNDPSWCLYYQCEFAAAAQGGGGDADNFEQQQGGAIAEEIYTVKTGLNRFINRTLLPNFAEIMNDVTFRLTTIRFEAMKLAYLHVIRLYDIGMALPSLTETFFLNCYYAVSTAYNPHITGPFNDSNIRDTFDIYCGLRPQALVWTSRSGLGNSLNYAAVEEVTTAKLNISINLQNRMIRYVNARLHQDIVPTMAAQPNTRIITRCATLIVIAVWETIAPRPLTQDYVSQNPELFWPMHIMMLRYIENLPAAQLVQEHSPGPSNRWYTSEVEKLITEYNIEDYIPAKPKAVLVKELKRAIRTQTGFQAHNIPQHVRNRLQTESITRMERVAEETIQTIQQGNFHQVAVVQPRGFRRQYSVLPQHDYTIKYVQVDGDVLFNIGGLDGQRYFDERISTDGFSVSVQCKRPRLQRAANPTSFAFNIPNNAIVFGADPGINSLVTATNWSTRIRDRFKSVRISRNEFPQQSLRIPRIMAKTISPVRQYEQHILIHRTADFDTYCDHIRNALIVQPLLLEYHQMIQRTLKFTTYRWSQQIFATYIRRFKLHNRFRQRQQVVIAYGSAHFYHAMRGNRSVPVEKFKRIVRKYLTVVPTSEIRTSKECSHLCRINDQDFLNNPWQDLRSIHSEAHPDGTRGGTLYKIKICTIDNTIWDRDVNAARNILYVFYSENTNQQRPINFNPRRAAA
ncbi:hypothetical protein BDC45DRAFT_553085 [Circinella umbellata]|nr:hypothetical protein BDC45DRAFT_553085 [Circinella umbellata]